MPENDNGAQINFNEQVRRAELQRRIREVNEAARANIAARPRQDPPGVPRPARQPNQVVMNDWANAIRANPDQEQQADVLRDADMAWIERVLNTPASTKKLPPESTVQHIYGITPIREAQSAMKAHKDANLFGIELEIEGWPEHYEESSSTGFRFTHDGSLRGQSVEAIGYPNSIQGIIATTKELWTKYGVDKKNFSERTSIHIHANVLNFTEDQIRSLMLTYATLEDLLFDFIGQDRQKNIFCVPWSEAGIGVGRLKDIFNTPRAWQKYTALNLCPIRTQGTVEFRHMEGHADIDRLTTWLQIIDDILWYARSTEYKVVFETISNLNTNSEYYSWAGSVLKNSIGNFPYEQVRAKLARGVIEAKLLAI